MSLENNRILIIDDEPELIKTLQIRLEAEGYQVLTAYDGIAGLKKAEEEDPDLLILDVVMPGMDGYAVCERMKASPRTRNIPVIMLTAQSMGDDIEKGFEKKADWYMVKPYDNKKLLQIIKKFLRKEFIPS